MKKIFLFLAAVLVLSSCAGFKPVEIEHDSDKEAPIDYRDGDWLPKNS